MPVTATATEPGLENFRDAIERALAEADADERLGPLLGATGLRMRFEFTDADLDLNVAAGEDGRNLSWSFDTESWPARLVLTMETPVANRFLQGAESLAIAIARGRVRCNDGLGASPPHAPAP